MKKFFIEKEIVKLIKIGSSKEELESLKQKLEDSIFYKDRGFEEVIDSFLLEMKEKTDEFLNAKKDNQITIIKGLSSMIYIPDFNNNSIRVKFIGGKGNNSKVNTNTLFDVASITKLFTLVLLFKLEELGYIDLNRPIVMDNDDFSGLEDFTYNDLIKLHGELATEGNIVKGSNTLEANEILNTLYLKSDNRNTNKYTDFGAIAMSKTIEKVMSTEFNREVSFAELMDIFIFKPFELKCSCFNPTSTNITGNGEGTKVHDPKARILGGAVGSAGLFTNSEDLAKFARELFIINYVNYDKFLNIISKENLNRLGQITYPQGNEPQKGNLGVYVKHPLGLDKTWVSNLYSNGSFAHQGWTGPVAIFDPNNLIHNNILVNAISNEENPIHKKNDKVIGYMDKMGEYISFMAECSLKLLFTQKYFNKYTNEGKAIIKTM